MSAATESTRQTLPEVVDMADNKCAICKIDMSDRQPFVMLHRKAANDAQGRYVRLRVHDTCVILAAPESLAVQGLVSKLLHLHDTAHLAPFLVRT